MRADTHPLLRQSNYMCWPIVGDYLVPAYHDNEAIDTLGQLNFEDIYEILRVVKNLHTKQNIDMFRVVSNMITISKQNHESLTICQVFHHKAFVLYSYNMFVYSLLYYN